MEGGEKGEREGKDGRREGGREERKLKEEGGREWGVDRADRLRL